MEQNVKTRKQQAQETKQRIFDVTLQLIRERGIENVQIDEISRKAGVSTGLFYNYFDSKVALITEAANMESDQYYEKVRRDYLGNLRGEKKILEFVHRISEYHEKSMNKSELKQIYAAFLTNADRGQSITNTNRPIYHILAEAVSEMASDGQLSVEVSPEDAAQHLTLLIRGVIFEYLMADETFEIGKAAEYMVLSHLNGIKRK